MGKFEESATLMVPPGVSTCMRAASSVPMHHSGAWAGRGVGRHAAGNCLATGHALHTGTSACYGPDPLDYILKFQIKSEDRKSAQQQNCS
jgi:hypothetical protein